MRFSYLASLLYFLSLLPHSIFANTSDTLPHTPFAGIDVTWINGQNRQTDFPLQYKDFLTAVAYVDAYYNYNFARPIDHTQTISATMGRTNEVTLNLVSLGIESNYKNTIARIWLQTGNALHIVQEQDPSVRLGRNTGTGNLKFIREAATGYHFDKWYGINVEAGIFMSFIGLESYLTQENWCYQRSMPCEMTPFYFQGARIQINPTRHLQTQVWLLNGWQTYNSFQKAPGLGSSTYYRPNDNLQLVANFYMGQTTPRINYWRFHHDNSVNWRYYRSKRKGSAIAQAALSWNNHFGFQSYLPFPNHKMYAYMIGTSLANRIWFKDKKTALTLRADYVQNPGLYLSFDPGRNAESFVYALLYQYYKNGVQTVNMFQGVACFDWMPNDHFTFRIEYGYRQANVPYFAGPGGTTSVSGYTYDIGMMPFQSDLRKTENRITLAVSTRI